MTSTNDAIKHVTNRGHSILADLAGTIAGKDVPANEAVREACGNATDLVCVFAALASWDLDATQKRFRDLAELAGCYVSEWQEENLADETE